MERLISLSPGGGEAFFDLRSFPWVAQVEQEWPDIRAELDRLLLHRTAIPNFQDISSDQALLTRGDQWKTYFFYIYGHRAEANCARCPKTALVLQRIPAMKTAMFSILAPGKRIPEHRGPYKGVLRYHLGLLVPEPAEQCGIRVLDQVRHWEEGQSLIFDDTHLHEAWNGADSYRVVLFVDFVRPVWFPLSLLNRAMVWLISRTLFVTTAADRVRETGFSESERASAGD